METWGIHGSTANSNHKGLVSQALISSFMVTKQTFELPVIWETGMLVTSLWLRNRCWLIIHWILWPLIPKPQQCYFHNFWYNVTNITRFPRHMKIKVTTFPSGITKHEGLIAKIIYLIMCSKFRANHFRNIELIINHLFPNSWINTTFNCLW